MTVVDVNVRTVYQRDYAANSDKFYRTYTIGPYCVFQWGRRGTLGQFEVHTTPSAVGADNKANSKINDKRRSGYADEETAVIRFDLARFTPDSNPKSENSRKYGRQLAAVYDASAPVTVVVGTTAKKPAGKSATPRPAADPHRGDQLAEFTADALAAITLAVTDPVKAGAEYAKLNARWAEVRAAHDRAESYLKTLDELVMGAA